MLISELESHSCPIFISGWALTQINLQTPSLSQPNSFPKLGNTFHTPLYTFVISSMWIWVRFANNSTKQFGRGIALNQDERKNWHERENKPIGFRRIHTWGVEKGLREQPMPHVRKRHYRGTLEPSLIVILLLFVQEKGVPETSSNGKTAALRQSMPSPQIFLWRRDGAFVLSPLLTIHQQIL